MSGDTLVNAETGQVIAQCTPDEARELTDRICTGLGVVWELVLEAYRTRAWAALGHGSWDAYCAAEFGRFHLRLPSEERDETIASLRSAGLSIRAIAATGVASKKTVERTIAASGVANDDTSTLGTDGKKYDAISRAKRNDKTPPPDPGKCTEGFDCPATPGPDGMCAWHRGKAAANKDSDASSSASDQPGQVPAPDPAQSPGEAGTAQPTDAAAHGESTGPSSAGAGASGGQAASTAPPAATLPDDWRSDLANACYLLRHPTACLADALGPDDAHDLRSLHTHLTDVLDIYQSIQDTKEQAWAPSSERA